MVNTKTTTKYIIYCRKSTEDKKRQVLSLDSQLNEMTKLSNSLGLKIDKVYKESKSAKMPDNRPVFSEMIKYIKSNPKESFGVLCWKIDRLSRNPIDSATIQWLLQQNRIKVIQTSDRQYLPSDNVLLFNVESSMANQYILDLSKNVKRGLIAKLEKGYWPNRAPIGYLNKDSKIIVDTDRAKYIIKAFKLYSSGKYSVEQIADTLFSEGFRGRASKKYHKSKIHRILSMPFYCGIMEKYGKKYLGKYESLISKKLFNDVQEVLKKKSHVKRQTIPFAFRGILKCQKCGCQLTATKKKGHLIYYYCTNGKHVCDEHKSYIREENMSKELIHIFDKIIFDEKLINLVYKAKLEESKSSSSYLDQSILNLKNRLMALQNQKTVLLDSYLDKIVSEEDYKAKKVDIENEMVSINQHLKELEKQKTSQDNFTLERIKNVFLTPKQMKKEFLSSNSEKQKNILNNLLWNVEVSDKKIANISFKQPYDMLSKIVNKSDFSLMRRERDSNPRYLAVHTLSRRAH